MTQEKMIQAFGRVGRSSSQSNYTLRIKNNELISNYIQKTRINLAKYECII